MLTVALEPWQQAGSQEGGFTRTGGAQNDVEIFAIALAYQVAYLIDRAHDENLPPEKDRRIWFVKGEQPRVG